MHHGMAAVAQFCRVDKKRYRDSGYTSVAGAGAGDHRNAATLIMVNELQPLGCI